MKETASAPEAMASIKKERFDAVLLDLILPGGRGSEVLDAVSKLPASRRPVVLVFTGLVAPEGHQGLLDRGASVILHKPHVGAKELVTEIVEAIGRKRAKSK